MEINAPKFCLDWKTAGIALGLFGVSLSLMLAFVSLFTFMFFTGLAIVIIVEIVIGKSTKHTEINQMKNTHTNWYTFVINCIISFSFSTKLVGKHHLAVWHHNGNLRRGVEKNCLQSAFRGKFRTCLEFMRAISIRATKIKQKQNKNISNMLEW